MRRKLLPIDRGRHPWVRLALFSLPGEPAPQRSLSCPALSDAHSRSFLERLVERFNVRLPRQTAISTRAGSMPVFLTGATSAPSVRPGAE